HAGESREGAPTFRHRGPRHRRLWRRRGHALTSDSSMSEAASELHSSRPGRFANPVKRAVFQQLIFQPWIAERPFRLAKFTACRKKCGFLSAQRHEVKAPDAEKGKISMQRFCPLDAATPNGDRSRGLQVEPVSDQATVFAKWPPIES